MINDFSSRSFRKRKCLKLVASLKEFRVAITKYVGISIYKIVDWQLAGGGGSKTNFFNFLGCSELRVASLDFNYLIIMDDTQNTQKQETDSLYILIHSQIGATWRMV